jgi:hypothetical protein
MADPTQLKFINEQERQYFAEAVMGEEVRQFLTSSVGRYLHGCAKAEYDRCRDKMFDLDPYTPEGKRKYEQLKADAKSAQNFMKWCVEAITTGNEAEVMLKEMRQGDER